MYLQVLFDKAFEYGGGGGDDDDDAKFWGYFGTIAAPLCVKFCNFVQCHIFVNHLTCYTRAIQKVTSILMWSMK
jgi:hypothetical protein